MNVRRFLPLAFLLATGLSAQDLVHVRNLAPDDTNVSPAEFTAILESLAPNAPAQSSGRVPLNLTGNGCTGSFVILSSANSAGLNGAFYKTELAIQTQWLSASIKVNIFAIPNNTNPLATPSAVAGGTFTLKGFTVYTWDNILDSLGLNGAGYIIAGVDSSTYNRSAYAMSAWANTYTAAPAGGSFRTPVPVFTDGSLFGSDSYRHPNVTQNASNRNNIVVYNVDTTRNLTVDVRFHPYTSSTWTTYTVTLAPGETRQYSFAAIFPGISGQGEMAMNYQSGGSWLGYVVRTDNGTNDGLLEIPYKFNLLAWPN
jgi:hypothetical protein